MATETKHNLDKTTVDKLQKLIRANIDSYDGFVESAEQIDDERLAGLFREIGNERSSLATELQQHVEWNGQEAEDDGSVAATIHRTWLNIRSKVTGGNATSVLTEAERGEDHIKHAYEDVIKATAGSAMNDVLLRQYQVVKSGHDKIRDLRDSYKNS